MTSDGEIALAEPLMRTEHDLELSSLSPLVERAHWTGGILQVGSAPIPIPHNPSVRLTRGGALWSDERPCDPRASRRALLPRMVGPSVVVDPSAERLDQIKVGRGLARSSICGPSHHDRAMGQLSD